MIEIKWGWKITKRRNERSDGGRNGKAKRRRREQNKKRI